MGKQRRGNMMMAKHYLGCLMALPMLGLVPALAEPVGDETFEGSLTCAAPAGNTDAAPISCQAQINPGLPEIGLSLVFRGNATNGERVLDSIELRRSGEAEPFQVLKGIALHVPKDAENGGVGMIDLNFDGFFDLRVQRSSSEGKGLYRNWVWSKEGGNFVASPELDAIASPEFNAEDQEIVSRWQRGANERTTDIYSFDGSMPLLVHREVDRLSDGGACQRSFYDRIDEELKETGTGSCDKE